MFSHYTFGKTTSKSCKFCQKTTSNKRRCQTQEKEPLGNKMIELIGGDKPTVLELKNWEIVY
ncbi:MAG: hypothetical protein EAZ07_04675 [Cytophagales bacterium]|nr:MAG: hypothetical protein EAZ07_04675 [Cytophagales bacterium]